MHKYFAKPLFLAKSVEYLPECHSTNEELVNRAKLGKLSEGHLLYTDHQLQGKGQRGNVWESNTFQNLLFSLYLTPRSLSPKDIYMVNIAAGLAILEAVQDLIDAKVQLKWPNDLYLNDLKAGGILVESSLNAGVVESLVVGMGMNVNQKQFLNTRATSLSIETGKTFNRHDLLENIIVQFEKYYLQIRSNQKSKIIKQYYQSMRWRGEEHLFQDAESIFSGEILGVDDSGKLVVKTNESTRRFDVKEITFIK